MLFDDRWFRDLIFEMSRWAARIRIKLLVAISVDRLWLCALLLLLLLLQAQAWLAYHLVAFFVHEQFALDALESLPPETPDSILAERAKGPLQIKPNQKTLYYITSRTCRVRSVSRHLARWKSRLSLTEKRSDNVRDAPTSNIPGPKSESKQMIIKFKYPVLHAGNVLPRAWAKSTLERGRGWTKR